MGGAMRSTVVKLERRGAALAVLAVILVSAYQALFFLAPDVMGAPLWPDSALTVALLLGNLSLVIPVVFAWWMIAADKPDGETFDTPHR
jgi:hypothetical protein